MMVERIAAQLLRGTGGTGLVAVSVVTVLVGAGVVGCVGAQGPGPAPAVLYGVDAPPLFMVLYYPFGPALDREVAAPIPDYRGWTDDRMEKDLDRMRAAGIDVVLLGVEEPDILLAARRKRLRRMVEFAERARSRGPLVGFFLDVGGEAAGDAEEAVAAFVAWHVRDGIGTSAGHFRLDGRPLVVFGPDAGAFGSAHPGLRVVHTSGAGAQWAWDRTPGAGGVAISRDGGQAVVYGRRGGAAAGGDSGGAWALAREHGEALRAGLWAAFRETPHFVCISSWNNFRAGDFVEPNSLDGRFALDVLKQEISRVRAAVGKPPVSSGP